MVKVEKTEVYGWEAAIRGMRNPMNSWGKSDSYGSYGNVDTPDGGMGYSFFIGDNDYDLMKRLVKSGSDHSKFMRMITVTCDITAPLYWWKEFDTYKVGTVANSCSTMHKIHSKELTLADFSHEHLAGLYLNCLKNTIIMLNDARSEFLDSNDKDFWWQMIQLLPTSYNQKRTVQLNYEVLRNMYHSRKTHKLDEWHTLCEWIKELPYSELITG
jgi:hypothetical protein